MPHRLLALALAGLFVNGNETTMRSQTMAEAPLYPRLKRMAIRARFERNGNRIGRRIANCIGFERRKAS
jgi:hypothetical protein